MFSPEVDSRASPQRKDLKPSRTLKKLWNDPTPAVYQRGGYSFKPELAQMRNYLDIMHDNHGLKHNYERIDGIPHFSNCVGRYHDFHSVAEKVKQRHVGVPKKKPATKTERQLDRFETDNVARKLRDVFFEQWSQSKVMCTQ